MFDFLLTVMPWMLAYILGLAPCSFLFAKLRYRWLNSDDGQLHALMQHAVQRHGYPGYYRHYGSERKQQVLEAHEKNMARDSVYFGMKAGLAWPVMLPYQIGRAGVKGVLFTGHMFHDKSIDKLCVWVGGRPERERQRRIAEADLNQRIEEAKAELKRIEEQKKAEFDRQLSSGIPGVG